MNTNSEEFGWPWGQRFVVTGAVGAMGDRQVLQLARAGAQVDALDQVPLNDERWSHLQNSGGPGTAIAHQMDVRSEAEWAEFSDRLD